MQTTQNDDTAVTINVADSINHNTDIETRTSEIKDVKELRKSGFVIQGMEAEIPDKPEVLKPKWYRVCKVLMNIVLLLALLYGFLVGLSLLADAFRVAAGKGAASLFSFCDNPITGLIIGVLSTVLFQSSSTTTSIIVSLVAANALTVGQAIYLVMGANIGTSITNTIVAIGQIKTGEEFRRAFSGATVHDFFNILCVLVFLPIEWIWSAFSSDACGMICSFTGLITEPLSKLGGAEFASPVDYIVKPLTKEIVTVNKKAYQAWSYGCSETSAHCDFNYSGIANHTVDYGCWNDKGSTCMNADEWHAKYDKLSIITSCWLKDSWHFNDLWSGIVLLILALIILCGCLVGMVQVLHALILGKAEKYLKKAFHMNGYLALVIGCLVTVVVQSSSVVTSALTPLVGVGVLPLHQMFAMTLGANIGTTTTSLLAALATGNLHSLQIALCHFFFNVFGVILWYPIPQMRKIPLGCATWLGRTVQTYRWFGFVYMLGVFVAIPLILLGFSLLFTSGKTTAIIGGVLLALLVILLISFIIFWKKFGGKEKIMPFIQKTAAKDQYNGENDDDDECKKNNENKIEYQGSIKSIKVEPEQTATTVAA